jgi:hypothetical protein
MACIGCISWVFTLLLEYDFFMKLWQRIKKIPSNFLRLGTSSMAYKNMKKNKEDSNVSKSEDRDVNAERTRIENCFYFSDANQNTESLINISDRLIMRSLRKVYVNKIKVFGKNGWLYQLVARIFCFKIENISNDSSSKQVKNKNEFVAVENLTFGVPAG